MRFARLLVCASFGLVAACAAAPYREVPLTSDLAAADLEAFGDLAGEFRVGPRTLERSATPLPLRLVTATDHATEANRGPDGRPHFSVAHGELLALGLLGGSDAQAEFDADGRVLEWHAGSHALLGLVASDRAWWGAGTRIEGAGRRPEERRWSETRWLWGLYRREVSDGAVSHHVLEFRVAGD